MAAPSGVSRLEAIHQDYAAVGLTAFALGIGAGPGTETVETVGQFVRAALETAL